ncbi:SPX domain-containing protein [Mycena latifolia]|nr:SPX domain-containing protein [Mycena latifolia]
MKFARYLEDNQTPEWQRAYINYRLLKKRITAIRRANGEQNIVDSPISTQINPNLAGAVSGPSVIQPIAAPNSLRLSISSSSSKKPPDNEITNASLSNLMPSNDTPEESERREPLTRSQTLPTLGSGDSQKSDRGRAPAFSRMFSSSNSKRRFTAVGPKLHPYSELPLRQLMPLLSPPELAFFTTLDAELDKIETFYVAREKEMQLRTKLLEDQLNELSEHRKLFNATHPSGAWASTINTAAILKLKTKLRREEEEMESAVRPATKNKGKSTITKAAGRISHSAASSVSNLTQEQGTTETEHGTAHLDPDEYYNAKHKLKKAVLEHYRCDLLIVPIIVDC